MFTSGHPRLKRLGLAPHRTGRGFSRAPQPSSSNPARGDVVFKNKIGALGGVVLLALGLAACGSAAPAHPARPPRAAVRRRRSPAPARRSPPRSTNSGPRRCPPDGQLPGGRLGRGDHLAESKTVDFGASDPPLKPADEEAIAKNGTPAVQIPMFLGAITVSYNLPGVKTGLKLEGKTIADIYLGKIKTWNDPEIAALNPGVTLPSTTITVIHRSDSSGTTSGFTSFLAAVDPEFKSKVGEGKDVQWPIGHRRQGQRRRRRRGPADDRRGRLRRAGLRAAAQLHLRLGEEQVRQLRRADAGIDQRRRRRRRRCPRTSGSKSSTPPRPAPTRSPRRRSSSSTRTSARPGQSESVAKGVVKFIDYGLGQGQSILGQADYASLPASILAKSKEAAAGLQCNGTAISAADRNGPCREDRG